jgi:FtsH-binding integral membrane protein
MGWIILAIWLVSFGLCVWLERSKLACIRKHAGWPMVVLFVVSGLTLAPVLLGQLLVDRLLSRVRVEDGKALNR